MVQNFLGGALVDLGGGVDDLTFGLLVLPPPASGDAALGAGALVFAVAVAVAGLSGEARW